MLGVWFMCRYLSSKSNNNEREKEKARQKLREEQAAVNTGARINREGKTTN